MPQGDFQLKAMPVATLEEFPSYECAEPHGQNAEQTIHIMVTLQIKAGQVEAHLRAGGARVAAGEARVGTPQARTASAEARVVPAEGLHG